MTDKMTDAMIDTISFSHPNISEPHLVVFGSVHGSEPCGTLAIERVAAMFERDELKLARGRITMVPRANAKAFEQGTRNYEGNLARLIVKKEADQCASYEEKIAQHLIPLIEDADYIIDLHSCSVQTPPFVFQDIDTKEAEDFCAHLGSEFVIIGWNDYFTGQEIPASVQAYANSIGVVCATIECGSHHDPKSADAGVDAILNGARHIGLLDGESDAVKTATHYRLIKHYMEDASGEMVQNFKGLQQIAKDEHILTYDRDGVEEKVYAPEDCRILMPSKNGYHPDQKAADIWTYLVKPV